MSATTHTVRWFVYVADGVMIPRESTMRGTWGYDVKCSCGWQSRLGGGTRRAVQEVLDDHRFGAMVDADWR